VDVSEAASPERVEEPEPRVMAEPLKRMSGVIVAEDEEDVWVPPVAKPEVAESRVAVVVDDMGGPLAVGFPVLQGKRRRVDNSSEEGGSEVGDGVVESVVPLGPREGAPTGPRLERFGGRGRGSSMPADLFVRRVVFVTGRGGAGFHSPDPALTRGRGGMFRVISTPPPSGAHPHSFPERGPVCYHLFLTGTRLGYGWGGGLSGDRGRECRKRHPAPGH